MPRELLIYGHEELASNRASTGCSYRGQGSDLLGQQPDLLLALALAQFRVRVER